MLNNSYYSYYFVKKNPTFSYFSVKKAPTFFLLFGEWLLEGLPIDTKLAVWVAYIKTQLWIATQMSVIKVKVTVTKNRNSVSAQ